MTGVMECWSNGFFKAILQHSITPIYRQEFQQNQKSRKEVNLTEPRDCPGRERIKAYCPCPKPECPNHGACCQCILSHRNREQDPVLKRLPACVREMVREALEGRTSAGK